MIKRNNFIFFDKGTGMRRRVHKTGKSSFGSIIGLLDPKENSLDLSKGLDSSNCSQLKLKFMPSAKDLNKTMVSQVKSHKKIGKIIDPIQQEVKT